MVFAEERLLVFQKTHCVISQLRHGLSDSTRHQFIGRGNLKILVASWIQKEDRAHKEVRDDVDKRRDEVINWKCEIQWNQWQKWTHFLWNWRVFRQLQHYKQLLCTGNCRDKLITREQKATRKSNSVWKCETILWIRPGQSPPHSRFRQCCVVKIRQNKIPA